MKKVWFSEKTVIISGATSGIGYELAALLIKNYSCTVIGAARNTEKLASAENALGRNFVPFVLDVSKKQDWLRLYGFLKQNGITPSLIINNAGYFPTVKKAADSETEAEKAIETNYYSVVYSCALIKLFNDKACSGIVNISSAAALAAFCGTAAYSASKSAVLSFSEALAIEEKPLYVGYVMPGFVSTNLFARQSSNEKQKALFSKFSMPPDKCAKKIVKRIIRKKRRTVIGVDAKLMSAAHRLMPVLSIRLMNRILKSAKLQMFEDAF